MNDEDLFDEDENVDLIGEEESIYEWSMEDQSSDKSPQQKIIAQNRSPNSSLASRIGVSKDDKAGLEQVDVTKVNEIIYEHSKDSKFFKNEERKNKRIEDRAKELQKRYSSIQNQPIDEHLARTIEKEIEQLEAQRDLTHTYFHVDMDAFYASVEIVLNPELKGKPIGVGGKHMLSTSSYEARKFGVKSAMPGFLALKLCPQLIIVPPHYDKYKEASILIRSVFAIYDPSYISYSLDEASLSVTNYMVANSITDPQVIAKEIQAQIFQKTQLTCSIGCAPNRRLAKICADKNKPNGFFRLMPELKDIIEFMHPLPIRRVSGIGKVTEKLLHAINITTCGELYEKRLLLYQLFSHLHASFFIRVSLGLGSPSDATKTKKARKSISTERTFSELSHLPDLLAKCHELASSLSNDLQSKDLRAKTVTLKLKSSSFVVTTRCMTLQRYVNSTKELYECGKDLILKEAKDKKLQIRLMGLRASHFQSDDEHKSSSSTIDRFLTPATSPIKLGSIDQNNKAGVTLDLNSEDGTKAKLNPLQLAEKVFNSEEKPQQCPVCSADLSALTKNNSLLNQHLDKCLKIDSTSGSLTKPEAENTRKRSNSRSKSPSKPGKKGNKVAQQNNTIDKFFVKKAI